MSTLILFARWPIAGHVKTRLAASIGAEAAARLYDAFLRDTLARTRGICDRRVIAYSPADVETEKWFRSITDAEDRLRAQAPGDLGTRLDAAVNAELAVGAPVLVIGTDSPTISRRLMTAALLALQRADLVFAPASDGGYVLIGLSTPCAEVFQQIPWSTPTVLSVSLSRARAQGRAIEMVEAGFDVDSLEDLMQLQRELNERSSDDDFEIPRCTHIALRTLFKTATVSDVVAN